MKVLVSAASRHGGTAEIATELGARLRELGAPWLEVEVRPIGEVATLAGYDGVVLGSGVYLGRWLGDARHFVTAHAGELRLLPVWLFSSGPVGDPLQPDDGHAVEVAGIVAAVDPVAHRVFPGRIDRSLLGFGERTAVQALHVPSGDFRDWAVIRSWAQEIASDLTLHAASARIPILPSA